MKRLARITITASALGAAALAGAAAPAAAATYLGGVDMQRACNVQYAGFGYRAVVLSSTNAYSWSCRGSFDGDHGIDVNGACANQYGRGAYSGLRDARNPYSWYCRR